MSTRLYVVSLDAEDVPAAARFYKDAIGLEPLPHHAGDRPHFDLGGCYLTLLPGRPALPTDTAPRFPAIALSVPDLEAAIERLRSNKVELPWGIESTPSARWVMFFDPGGNLVELVELDQARADG